MTRSRSEITIAASPQTVYAFASATDRWPLFLPHYRSVRVLEDHGDHRIVRMAAWRDWIPIAWVAEQWNDPVRPHVAFRHIRGPTRGMEVEWLFTGRDGATHVVIEHRLAMPLPFAAGTVERTVMSFFIENVAGKTLACMKALAESAAA